MIILNSLGAHSLEDCCCDLDPFGGCLCPPPCDDDEPTAEDLEQQITDTLAAGNSVDFSQSPYSDNPDIALQALGNLYPDLDINSLEGVKIEGNRLMFNDGGMIDLNTGKKITVEPSSGGKGISSFDNGEGLTIVDGIFVTYDGNDLTAQKVKQMKFPSKIKSLTVEIGEAEGIKVKSNGDHSIQSSRLYQIGDSVTVSNGEGIVRNADLFSVERGDNMSYFLSNIENLFSFDSIANNNFSVKQADVVIVGNNIFRNIKDAFFSTLNNALLKAEGTSMKDDNTITITQNPIEHSHENIEIILDNDESFEVIIDEFAEENLPEVELNIDQDAVINIGDIAFVTTGNDSIFLITDAFPPKYSFKNGILSFTSDNFTETVHSECELTTANIAHGTGIIRVSLSPFSYSCNGARYSYIDLINKERSYSILNTNDEYYELCFAKGNNTFKIYEQSHNNNSWGYINLFNNILLNSVIQYDRYREKSASETEQMYRNTNLIFMPVYNSYDKNNSAYLAFDNDDIEISIENDFPTNDTLSQINSGFHRILSKSTDGQVSITAQFNLDVFYPPYITSIAGSYLEIKPPINIIRRNAQRICDNNQYMEILTPGTGRYNRINDQLQSWASIESYNEAVSVLK